MTDLNNSNDSWSKMSNDEIKEQLKEWGFQSVPMGISLQKLAKYFYEGVRDGYDIVSNSDGYYRLYEQSEGQVLLFDDYSRFVDDRSEDFPPSKDECLLIREWKNVRKIWKGIVQNDLYELESSNADVDRDYGNTCLLHLENHRYCYIRGGYITEFDIEEEVEQYYSYMSNNTVPEPIVVTSSWIYVLEHECKVDKNILPKDLNLRNNFVEYFYDNIYDTDKQLEFDVEEISPYEEMDI